MSISYRQLTPNLRNQIIAAFNNGMECLQITENFGLSNRSVRRVLADAGINSKRRNRYTLNEHYFDSINTPEKAYLLGLMAADGCVTTSNYVVFESTEKSLTTFAKTQLQYSGELRIIYPKGGYAPHYRINFSSQQLASALMQKGVIAGRMESGICYLPDDHFLPAYLLGYFDGDGCAYFNKHRSGGKICIVSSMEFAQQLANRLGMGIVSQHHHQKVYYWTIYHRNHIQRFYNLVYQYPGLGLERKRQNIETILGSYKRG
ncbi:MAG: LAGLIDADG family homing endonuclease [Cyanobacteria bacterium P01_D01_bin.44]